MARAIMVIRTEAVSARRMPLGPVLIAILLAASGCATSPKAAFNEPHTAPAGAPPSQSESEVSLVTFQSEEQDAAPDAADHDEEPSELPGPLRPIPFESLAQLESQAQATNPTLRALRQEVAAARSKVDYVGRLPDPTVGANIFAHPIETAAGSQRANLTVMQMLPWLKRLDAQTQQACFEAMALQKAFEMERLEVIGDIRAVWYRLYVIAKTMETYRANQEQLVALIGVANQRISTGKASQGDVKLGTLEYSKLEEQIIMQEQLLESTKAELNRLVGRDAEVPVEVPQTVDVSLPDWSHAMLRQVAWESQPAIAAVQLQTQATRWGLEVARFKRRPDLSLGAAWFAIDDNRPPSRIVDVGQDAWSVGVQATVPLWHAKYDAMRREAAWKHAASHATVEATLDRFDAMLRDLWEQAKAAGETARLYRETILPQSIQTLEADQQSYTNGTVDFERVVDDIRNVLTLELGYHRALGQLGTALARIRQATGTDLTATAPTNPGTESSLTP